MLEIPALLQERSKRSGKLRLRESLINRRKQQVRPSSSMDRAPRCLRPHLCASAWVLLRGYPRWRGNDNQFTLCISSVVLWLFLRPACASHRRRGSFTHQLALRLVYALIRAMAQGPSPMQDLAGGLAGLPLFHGDSRQGLRDFKQKPLVNSQSRENPKACCWAADLGCDFLEKAENYRYSLFAVVLQPSISVKSVLFSRSPFSIGWVLLCSSFSQHYSSCHRMEPPANPRRVHCAH